MCPQYKQAVDCPFVVLMCINPSVDKLLNFAPIVGCNMGGSAFLFGFATRNIFRAFGGSYSALR